MGVDLRMFPFYAPGMSDGHAFSHDILDVEHRRDDLLEVALNMKDDQLADVEELFWF